ncbi:TIR domain-containing protein, partial [Mesorhizobium sp. M7A.F.Ca.MR.148.00.0.0]|uniref:TIR domain-containing protein n=1 Tax=Mesorhizobium sp. M7A.F.Ca.MR.148.00.0.0 TaxID=2496775 RepID=UPI0019D28827
QRSGHWHVTVDVQGLRNGTRSSIRRIPGPLPEARDAPLSSVPSLVRDRAPEAEIDPTPREYDVFISHASEDKDEIVRPLAEALRGHGLRVWYDEFELRIGDSLRRKIDLGLANSRVGIVVLSTPFFGKGWTNYELDGIVSRAVNGEQQLLPIWHKVSKADVMKFSPSLVDKVARNTVQSTPQEIADEIAHLLSGSVEDIDDY